MITLHLISHTHWDREWHMTFQQFRLRLVKLIDDLLDQMAADVNYRHYTLDGQTIILDDYLLIRPERENELRTHIENGRLLVGPWHILPDEFLVSPEATIRNLLQGDRTARRFGRKMKVGYIPDPFGHIGQMPQILSGFGIRYACVQRGLDHQPLEFLWHSPDGSRVLMSYLRDGYSNAANLPVADPEVFIGEARRLAESLHPYTATSHLLLMHGTDHLPVNPGTTTAINYANQNQDEFTLIHSTLPEYFYTIEQELGDRLEELPVITGELRSSRRHHLLPGVLSTRAWIKQRNHACETLLERWAEPFSVFNSQVLESMPDYPSLQFQLDHPETIIRQAWQMLMENHPHDSICGCSVDQVHKEMASRFDQVEQIGEELVRQSLEGLAACTDTSTFSLADHPAPRAAIVIFNPNDWPLSGPVEATVESQEDFLLFDSNGQSIPYELIETTTRTLAELVLDRPGFLKTLGGIAGGQVAGTGGASLSIQNVRFTRRPEGLYIEARLTEKAQPDMEMISRIAPELGGYLADQDLNHFIVTARTPSTRVRLLAPPTPPHGITTCWLIPAIDHQISGGAPDSPSEQLSIRSHTIENEFYQVTVSPQDGTLTLLEKNSGRTFTGLNRLVDGGDAGDEYNYSPPENDLLLQPAVRAIAVEHNSICEALHIDLELIAPNGLSPDRLSRSDHHIPMNITVVARLYPGLARLDLHTRIDNHAANHRLRVHYPFPWKVERASYDGHFEIVQRPVGVPVYDSTWVEDPRPEVPQRQFTAVEGPGGGLVVANRGIREAEMLTLPDCSGEIALTLLRCVGWLSRNDFSTRRGDAGPRLPTPEAQMLGRWDFDTSIIPYQPGQALPAYHLAYAFNAPLRASTTGIHSGSIDPGCSFLQTSNPSFVFSSVKAAEDGDGWVLRGYNLTDKPLQIELQIFPPPTAAAIANLAEEVIAPLTISTGRLSFEAGSYQIITIRLSN